MRNMLFAYFGVFNPTDMISELFRFGKDILWWISTRNKYEKIAGLLVTCTIIIRIFTINPTPQFVLSVIVSLFVQVAIFSYLLYIASMYWFVRLYRYKQRYLLGNREALHNFVIGLKEKNFFKVTDTKLIADGKTNSNELHIIAAIVIPSKAQVGTMRRYIVYIILFLVTLLFLNSYGILLIAAILAVTFVYMSFYDMNAVSLIMESFRQTAQAIYNYHAYNPKKCKKFIEGSTEPDLKQLDTLYNEVIKNT